MYRSHAVHKCVCSSNKSAYIVETPRYIDKRVNEHMKKDKNSHIFKQLQSCDDCKESNKSKRDLKLKESEPILFSVYLSSEAN